MSQMIKTDPAYRDWVTEIAKRFRNCQIKAAMKVNDEMLRFYWQLGRDISELRLESKYGTGFYKKLSNDLHEIFPDVHSFSVTNLKYMHYFYELFPGKKERRNADVKFEIGENRPQPVDNSIISIHPQPVDEFDSDIFRIPWGHYRSIVDKCRGNTKKALFYVHKTLENNWSRAVLMNFPDTDLYERQGKAVTNFALTLPEPQSDLAQAITRDPYNFDFLTIRERYDEKELKDAMMANAEKFFLELGNGFAFLGREFRLEVGNTEKFIDLLFYNVRIHCYVVIEVKASDFDSAYAGQLGTYVVAVNHQLKTEQDNPTVGILICKNMDRIEVQYALESSSQPLGVSTYQLSKLVPEEFKGSLPTIEEIEAEFADHDDSN